MENKKIFFIVSRMHGGGAQKVMLHLLNFLADHTKWNVTLVLFKSKKDDSYLKFISPNSKIEVLNATSKVGWYKLYKLIKLQKPDVVFSTLNYINVSAAVATIASRSRLRLIAREARPVSKTSAVVRIAQKATYWRINKCWAITPEIASELNSMLRIPRHKIILAPNPLDSNWNENPVTAMQPQDIVRISYVGRLIGLKNIDALIESLYLIKDKKWHLKIIGSGDQEAHLKDLVARKNLQEQVDFVGYSSNPYQYMLESDIFCLPSRFEGFPNVVTEALACGNLCIANNTIGGGVKYIKQLIDTVEVVDFTDFVKVSEILSHYMDNRDELAHKKRLGAELAQKLEIHNYYQTYFKTILE